MDNAHDTIATAAPFDTAKLDRLMDEAGLDILIATSRHNVQYLLGGYRFFVFEVNQDGFFMKIDGRDTFVSYV